MANQNKKLKSGHYTFWKCYIQEAPQKTQYDCFLRGATYNFENKWFLCIHYGYIVTNQIKQLESGTFTFWNAIYRVPQKRSNITASFAKHLKFQESMSFIHILWVNSEKSNKTIRIRKLCILKILYTGCSKGEAISQLPSWNI